MTGQHPPVPRLDVLAGLLREPSVQRLQTAMAAAEKKHGRPTNAAAIADADPAILEALSFGLAWEGAVGALPEGWSFLVGAEWEDGLSWWATASIREGPSQLRVVSSDGGVLYGTPTQALQALTEKLRTRQ